MRQESTRITEGKWGLYLKTCSYRLSTSIYSCVVTLFSHFDDVEWTQKDGAPSRRKPAASGFRYLFLEVINGTLRSTLRPHRPTWSPVITLALSLCEMCKRVMKHWTLRNAVHNWKHSFHCDSRYVTVFYTEKYEVAEHDNIDYKNCDDILASISKHNNNDNDEEHLTMLFLLSYIHTWTLMYNTGKQPLDYLLIQKEPLTPCHIERLLYVQCCGPLRSLPRWCWGRKFLGEEPMEYFRDYVIRWEFIVVLLMKSD